MNNWFRRLVLFFMFLVIVVAFAGSGWLWLRWPTLDLGPFHIDRMATFFCLLILGSALLACLQLVPRNDGRETSYGIWLVLSTLGALLMVTTNNLLMIFIAYELSIFGLMLGISAINNSLLSDEVKLKYFMTSGVSAAFFLMGLAIFYTQAGSFDLYVVQEKLMLVTDTLVLKLALIGFLVGIGYQLAWVPFQFVIPDLYAGAHTPGLGYMSVVTKLSTLALLLRFINVWWQSEGLPWSGIFMTMAILCLLVGHIAALVQTNLKRRLAYTSFGQVGFLMAGIASACVSPALQEKALSAVLFYCVAYSVMLIGAFAMVWALRTADNVPVEDSDYAGLAERAPWGAACLALFLCALSGLPPTIGFMGKFDLVRVVMLAGHTGLVCVMLLAWVLSAATYIPVIWAIYFKSSRHERTARISYSIIFVVASCALLTLYWGLLPDTVLRVAAESARALIY